MNWIEIILLCFLCICYFLLSYQTGYRHGVNDMVDNFDEAHKDTFHPEDDLNVYERGHVIFINFYNGIKYSRTIRDFFKRKK